jgi:hypothetical protein
MKDAQRDLDRAAQLSSYWGSAYQQYVEKKQASEPKRCRKR